MDAVRKNSIDEIVYSNGKHRTIRQRSDSITHTKRSPGGTVRNRTIRKNRVYRASRNSIFKAPKGTRVERKGRFTIIDHSVNSPSPTKRRSNSKAFFGKNGKDQLDKMSENVQSLRGTNGANWVTAKDTQKTLRMYDAEKGKKEKVEPCVIGEVLPKSSEEESSSEKKAASVGMCRKHLMSRQTSVNMSMSQVLYQERALTSLILQQQAMQHALGSYVCKLDANAIQGKSCRNDTEDLLDELYDTVEKVVLENKTLESRVATLESELQKQIDESTLQTSIASELRARCNRLDRKYNDEKTALKALQSLMDDLHLE